MNQIYYLSPIGELTLVEEDKKLVAVFFTKEEIAPVKETPLLKKVRRQLKEYFDGKRKVFDLPLQLHETEFTTKVLSLLQEIPFGETKTYGELADALGSKKYSRAVGGACGRNPIPIIIPCHRVLGKGHMGGFSGGLPIKEKLLELEGVSEW